MKIKTNLKSGFDVSTQMVPTGPIWDDDDAASKCSAACHAYGMCPNGNWITNVPGQASSCSCNY